MGQGHALLRVSVMEPVSKIDINFPSDKTNGDRVPIIRICLPGREIVCGTGEYRFDIVSTHCKVDEMFAVVTSDRVIINNKVTNVGYVHLWMNPEAIKEIMKLLAPAKLF